MDCDNLMAGGLKKVEDYEISKLESWMIEMLRFERACELRDSLCGRSGGSAR